MITINNPLDDLVAVPHDDERRAAAAMVLNRATLGAWFAAAGPHPQHAALFARYEALVPRVAAVRDQGEALLLDYWLGDSFNMLDPASIWSGHARTIASVAREVKPPLVAGSTATQVDTLFDDCVAWVALGCFG